MKPTRIEKVPGFMLHGFRSPHFVVFDSRERRVCVWCVTGFDVQGHGRTVREACAAWRSRLPWWRRLGLWWRERSRPQPKSGRSGWYPNRPLSPAPAPEPSPRKS